MEIPDDVLSPPDAITFRGEGGADAHAFYYPPRNPSFTAPEGELPPLLVSAHGGPTGVRSNVLDAEVQFWTSRGIAYVEVNYGGSSAHGRAYRERVNGASGIVDVGDCVAAARHLVATGRADSRRLLIHGGSAGGYIALCALAFHDVFAAGASSFGIADLELLQEETHKFESRYGDSLTGPWPAARSVYRERSPIHHLDRVRAAVLLLQGEDDPVVPPNQTLMMFDGLRQRVADSRSQAPFASDIDATASTTNSGTS